MLALVAGQGRLPAVIASSLDEPPLVASLEGFTPDGLSVDLTFRIEQLGSFLTELKGKGVTEVCFAGAVRRPPLDPSAIDAATMPLVPQIMQALQSGDDAALRVVLEIFEEAGISIRAAHEVLPELLPDSGVITATPVSPSAEQDAARAAKVVAALGTADVGQACAVKAGQALALEGSFGTDWMLDSLTQRPDGGGGILYKAPKPAQDRRIDLPTIGPETVRAAAAAKLDGVVIEANGVMILDLDSTMKAADDLGVFIWVRQP